MNNLNTECSVGEVAVLLYPIRTQHYYFRVGEELLIVGVADDCYRAGFLGNVYQVEKSLVMRKDNWIKLKKEVLADAIKLLSQ